MVFIESTSFDENRACRVRSRMTFCAGSHQKSRCNVKKGYMDIDTFLQMRPVWGYEPCLYIVKQMFPGNNAYRCGAAGTQLFKNADLVYGADSSTEHPLLPVFTLSVLGPRDRCYTF